MKSSSPSPRGSIAEIVALAHEIVLIRGRDPEHYSRIMSKLAELRARQLK